MAYTIQTSQNIDYILVKVEMDVTIDIASEFAKKATSEGTIVGINKMLIDIRGHKSATTFMEKYAFAHGRAERVGITRSWKICLLCDSGDERTVLLETVMRNAGYNYKVAYSESHALDWLNSSCRAPYHFGYR
ncbi:MAG: hypothetical protein C0624_00700 [Desulfuromonas sp.]|nr:MAG: hypothetical protein C0624_00700 [Desulfuromonas sp.]